MRMERRDAPPSGRRGAGFGRLGGEEGKKGGGGRGRKREDKWKGGEIGEGKGILYVEGER